MICAPLVDAVAKYVFWRCQFGPIQLTVTVGRADGPNNPRHGDGMICSHLYDIAMPANVAENLRHGATALAAALRINGPVTILILQSGL